MGDFYHIVNGRAKGTTSFVNELRNEVVKLNREDINSPSIYTFNLNSNQIKTPFDYTHSEFYSLELLRKYNSKVHPYGIPSVSYGLSFCNPEKGGIFLIESIFEKRNNLLEKVTEIIKYINDVSEGNAHVYWFETFENLTADHNDKLIRPKYDNVKIMNFLREKYFANGLSSYEEQNSELDQFRRMIRLDLKGDIDLNYFENMVENHQHEDRFKAILYSHISYIKSSPEFLLDGDIKKYYLFGYAPWYESANSSDVYDRSCTRLKKEIRQSIISKFETK